MAQKEKPWWERAWDWAVEGEDTPPTPYIDPKTKRAVTNVQPTRPDGRRTQPNPYTSWTEFFTNIKNNLGLGRAAETARGMVRGIKDIPQAMMFFDSARRGFSAEKMSPKQYYDMYLSPAAQAAAMTPEAGGMAYAFAPRTPRPSDAQIRQIMQRDIQAANALANAFTYRDPKGELHFDMQGMWRSVSQDPTGTLAAIVTAGEGAAVKGAGIAGNLARTAQVGSRTARLANITEKALKVAANTAKTAKWVANPIIPATSAVIQSAPVRSAATATINAVRGRQSIYRPEFTKAWTPFKDAAEERLRASGVSDDVIASPEAQQRIFDMFNQQTGGRFADPLTPRASAAMREAGLDPASYAAPHLGSIIEDTVNAKRGITPAIMNEGAMRVAGARNVTRSAATGEAPGMIFRNQEGPARARSEADMAETLSGRFAPPPGSQAPGLRDVTDDFINTQMERRNAFGDSYAAAARNDGVYSDPNAFVSNLDQEAANLLRQRGIDPTELQSNAEIFRGANTTATNLRRNIQNHGASVPPIEESVGGVRYSLDRQYNIWLDQNGNPAPNLVQRALNSDPTVQARINAPAPQPVNRLSLENLEIERRRLNAAAERAYQQGVQNGDFREYNAITAYRDALDNTSINMGTTFTGDAQAAIPRLQQGRAQYQEWRNSGIDSPNPIVRDAAQRVMQRTEADPASGQYRFNDTPGARDVVADAFAGKIVGTDGVAPSATFGSGATTTNPAETFTALSRTLSPNGQGALRGYVRAEGYGRPGATTNDILDLDRSYASQGIDLLTPEERNFLNISVERRMATSPQNIPQRDPFNWNPFADVNAEQSGIDKAMKIAGPFVKGGVGYSVGNLIGGPGMGMALSGMGALEDPLMRGVKQIGLFRNEQGGAPRYSVGIPDTQAPLAIGMTYGSQVAQQGAEERQRRADEEALKLMGQPPSLVAPAAQGTSAIPPVSALPARKAPNVTASEDAAFLKSIQPSTADEDAIFLKGLPQPQSTGGRAAYKSGGAVNDIEPLVRNLMNRAQQAKKMTNKDTEVLLNSHDDAIASALEVAQKAI